MCSGGMPLDTVYPLPTFSMPTSIITHEACLDHDTGPYHPERPERLRAVLRELERHATGYDLRMLIDTADPPEQATISAVHSDAYIASARASCRRGLAELPTGDTAICKASVDSALAAVGCVVRAVDQVVAGQDTNAFCAVRPPGHHAGSDRGMGFCIINNVAVGARYAQEKYGLKRILIIDWDVHHGNGTQQIFEYDPTVFYMSIHEYPLYPYSGWSSEDGKGPGTGYTMNIPVSKGAGNNGFLQAFNDHILPTGQSYKPDLIMVSAGFDAHRDDPLAGANVTETGFTAMTDMVIQLADECCEGKVVSVMEGGYDIPALTDSVLSHVSRLAAT